MRTQNCFKMMENNGNSKINDSLLLSTHSLILVDDAISGGVLPLGSQEVG